MSVYDVTITVALRVNLSDTLVERAQDAAFVRDFYGLDTPEKIAEHLAWNIGLRECDLSRLDGFADLDNDQATVLLMGADYETEPAS